MIRGPDPSDGLVDGPDGLGDLFELLTAGVAEELELLQDLVGLHVADADGLGAAVDVVADGDGVFGGAGGDGEFDFGVGGYEFGEEGFDEAAGRGG